MALVLSEHTIHPDVANTWRWVRLRGWRAASARERGANVSGIDSALLAVEIPRQRVPEVDFRVGEMDGLGAGMGRRTLFAHTA